MAATASSTTPTAKTAMTPTTSRTTAATSAFPQCGGKIVQTGEDCDDGNEDQTDSCRNDCTFPECGDGFAAR